MKLKTIEVDGSVYAETRDGKPVYVADDGKDVAFDAPATRATITRLNAEAKGHREAKEAAEDRLRLFDGLDDPTAARKAIETVRNLDDKKLIDAGAVEKVKAEAAAAFEDRLKAIEAKYKPIVEERESYREALHRERIGNAFNGSKYIADKLAIPADMVMSRFGSAFSIEDGRIIGKESDGKTIYSRERAGEVAEFEEAIERLVDLYPYRDTILKGSGAHGGGSGSSGFGSGGKRTITRKAFDALGVSERKAAAFAAGRGEVDIVD